MSMRPIPETTEADDEWGPFTWGGSDLLERFIAVSAQVRELVPECVGMSISLREEGITLTLVASAHEIAVLDAVQYVDSGSCVTALEDGELVAAGDASTVEERWRLHAAATAAHGVESTLSLPLLGDGDAVAGFNLYASSSTAFDGRHDELAALLGAWADGAITNADLSFRTRDLAKDAPAVLRESAGLAVAGALLARSLGLEQDAAEERLRQAALRAAVPLPALVRSMVEVLGGA